MSGLRVGSPAGENSLIGQSRSWFCCRLADYACHADLDAVYGRLVQGAASSNLGADAAQVVAWQSTLPLLRDVIGQLLSVRPDLDAAGLFIEYEIPRRSKRIDAVIVNSASVAVIEFKTSTDQLTRSAVWQVEDYALDLRDFHHSTRGKTISCVVAASDGEGIDRVLTGSVVPIRACTMDRMAPVLDAALVKDAAGVEPAEWDASRYDPTPNVITATRHLFSTHSVDSINRASADNLDETLRSIQDIARVSLRDRRHAICFVTGVPGSGKTLAGLSAAQTGDDQVRAAYLSGNGPLVAVLREAVARDAADRHGGVGTARRHAETLIQNVHRFIDEYGIVSPTHVPPEQVVVFDEAQRAWHAERMTSKRRRDLPSEPSLMLEIMGRHESGCLVVALVGHGQEIHNGEAGLSEWGRAIVASSVKWDVYASPEVLRSDQPDPSRRLFGSPAEPGTVQSIPSLHLSAVIRSPRATQMAKWVDAVLAGDPDEASGLIRSLDGFRIGLTRSLASARLWLRDAGRDEMRAGLVASSGALRLRPEGLELDTNFQRNYPIERWFLDGPDDVRSSHALEVAMTEFSCQGLEIDFAGVCWDADLRFGNDSWRFHRFSGNSWRRIKRPEDQLYLLNKYRVLLTRAREGMVIYVPPGSPDDATRVPAWYDETANYLLRCGLSKIEDVEISPFAASPSS